MPKRINCDVAYPIEGDAINHGCVKKKYELLF